MIQNQLKNTTKPYRCLFDLRNIQKAKVEHLVNARLLHQLHKDYDESTAKSKIPFKNIGKPVNNQRYLQCIHKPLSINHQMSDSVGGNRMYLERYPSVTTILSNTKPPNEFFGLMNWRKSNIERFGKEKFGLMQKDTTIKGTTFHQDMKEYFAAESSNERHHKLHTSGFIKSVCNVLPNISNPLAVESSVVHSSLGYAGTIDLVAEYMGILSVIDWKTSQKKKVNLTQCHSYPIQISAYAGAINFDLDYPFQILNSVLVIAYENGDPADVHIMNEQLCEEYWEKWLIRLHQYKAMKSRDSVEPKRTGWAIIEDQYVSTSLISDENGPQERLSEGAQMIENGQNLKSFVRRQPVFDVKQNRGKSLNEIGKTVKDEEIVATWRNLTGLTESIFGRVLISKGLLMTHYITSIFKVSMKKIFNSMDLIPKKGNQFHEKKIGKHGSA
ncbi:uncharacterized protein LOC116286306 [Actinia tenebrosa]|uniref:Mitochondrial genome maintenance exonuclease 1 n=1 Tax=Actinia tenebrosa TaxID=6105 RepID=A0A6P8GYP0_ACTTE|nr:uncharacterized protein LOC116286306 [Actinia tenebrosa]